MRCTLVPGWIYMLRICLFQLSAFLEGFYNIIPKRLISIFNEQELELLLSGLPSIDIDDLKANTEYHKYLATSLQVRLSSEYYFVEKRAIRLHLYFLQL